MAMLVALSAMLALAPVQQRTMAFDTTLKSVAVFRDGYGYYVREGKVKLDNGWATTNFTPNAIRGTVWVYSLDPADKVEAVITTRDNRLEFSGAQDLKSKLSEKIGLRLVVIAHGGQRFEGELKRLLDDMLLLQVGSGFSAVPFSAVQSVSLVGYPVRVKVATKDPGKTASLGMAYLQEGIRWEPSYVLNVRGGTAALELRASMQNTTESLKESDVLFVVGSPFVANRGIQDMVGLIPPTAVASSGAAESEDRAPGAPRQAPATPAANATIAGEEAGELFFYKKQNLSLATNDVAMVSIFDTQVPVAPQFEWNADGDEVLYLLSIKNNTKQPLTTGPVFVVEDGKALGQETIRYTPPGANAEVKLSRGIGLRVEKSEAEVKRGATVKIGKSEFIPITLKGMLTVTNFRSAEAPLKVTKTVRGRVLTQSDEGRLKQTQVLSGEVNPINDLEWKLRIGAGQTKTITYTVETFVFADRSGTPPVPAFPGESG